MSKPGRVSSRRKQLMKRAALKVAQSQIADADDTTAMTEALNRLYFATANSVSDIVATLTESERARLAVFCYGRVHLKAAGLAIAAQCGLDHLTEASGSTAAGRTILTQARERSDVAERSQPGRRSPITLAARVSSAFASSAAFVPAEA
jgi:hypothetical protein